MNENACPRRSAVSRRILFQVWVSTLIIAAGWLAAPAQAQIDPSILQQPWLAEPHWAQTYDDMLFTDQGHTKGANLDTSIFWWDSSGRIKLDRNNSTPNLVIGYKVLANAVTSDDPRLNGNLWDIGLVAGGPVGQLGDGWDVSVLGGVGTANDGHWNSETLYGIGAVNVAHRIDANQTLHLGLDYNGNGLLYPDIPLPYLTYVHTVNDRLNYSIGAPRSALHYRPFERVILDLNYAYPINTTARAEFVLIENVRLFIQYSRNTDATHLNGTEHERLFYHLERALTGVRWITKWFDASLGVGYMLDHGFRSGFDIRATDKVANVSEEPFVSLIVQGTF